MSLANSAWPKYGRDLRNTSIQTKGGTPLPFPQVKWRTYKGSGFGSLGTPTLDEQGNIYVGDYDGWLTVLDQDGNVKWRYFVNDAGMDSSAAIGNDGTIYIGSYAYYPGQLLALNPDGSLKWVYEDDYGIYAPTIAPDGTIYVGGGHYAYAINPDGTLKWRQSGYTFMHPPAVDIERDVIYFPGVYAYKPDGQLVWHSDVRGGTFGPVVDGEGHIYITSYDGYVHAFYPDGTLKWGGPKLLPESGTGLSLGIDGSIIVSCYNGTLYAFDPDTGDLRWECVLGSYTASPCVSSSGVIYCTDETNYIFAVDHKGNLLWKFNAFDYGMGELATVILDDNGVLYYQEWEGYVVALIVENVRSTVKTNCTRLLTDAQTGKPVILF